MFFTSHAVKTVKTRKRFLHFPGEVAICFAIRAVRTVEIDAFVVLLFFPAGVALCFLSHARQTSTCLFLLCSLRGRERVPLSRTTHANWQ